MPITFAELLKDWRVLRMRGNFWVGMEFCKRVGITVARKTSLLHHKLRKSVQDVIKAASSRKTLSRALKCSYLEIIAKPRDISTCRIVVSHINCAKTPPSVTLSVSHINLYSPGGMLLWDANVQWHAENVERNSDALQVLLDFNLRCFRHSMGIKCAHDKGRKAHAK